jgi:hypothetical protein
MSKQLGFETEWEANGYRRLLRIRFDVTVVSSIELCTFDAA